MQQMRRELCRYQYRISCHTHVEYIRNYQHYQAFHSPGSREQLIPNGCIVLPRQGRSYLFQIQLWILHLIQHNAETKEKCQMKNWDQDDEPYMLFAIEHSHHIDKNTQG